MDAITPLATQIYKESGSSRLPDSPAKSTQQHIQRLQELQSLRQVQHLARLMDARFQIPGTPYKFGWDSVIGLIPGVGDALTAITGGWILRQAHRTGVSKRTMVRMVGNVVVDLTVGTIPVIGDVFDIYWKSNLRNAKLLEKHVRNRTA